MDKIQKITRELMVSDLKVREAVEGEKESRTIEGYAAKWNVRSRLLNDWWDNYYEILERGCMTEEMLGKQDIIFTQYHDIDKVLGRMREGKGTLTITLDEIGCKVSCEMPNTVWGNETLELVKRGDLTGMSFVYSTKEDDESAVTYELIKDEAGNEVYLRHVHRIDKMYDVSVVRFPAYEQTEVSAREREAIEGLKKKPETEDEDNEEEENDDTKKEDECKEKRERLQREVAQIKKDAQKALRQMRPLY